MNMKELAGKRVQHKDGNIYYIDSAMHTSNDVILFLRAQPDTPIKRTVSYFRMDIEYIIL
ncbi:hypothetical protein Spock_279 [Bacillus phage Spock]|uniref:Uncharacterized protein n=1 Tax=Bacillus phage Spock TaxID=1406791 RepID=U5PXP1_9CAUD|nr:hypothetical protein Spock_279 [Bacillus phage Spock]AGY48679.1 hypothetical protein Spock_279 [Bacillus phage Spock]